MKARRWLLVAAALTLLPSAALAQKKKPGKAPAAPAAAPAAPAAPPPGGEIELDAPAPGAAAPDAAAGTAPAAGDSGGGICEIDPSACPKAEDIKKAASKNVNAEIYAVEQIYALRYHRFEVQPYFSFTLNDQFVSHNGPGLALNYYITNVLAVGVNGNLYAGLNGDSDFNFQNRRATRVAVPLNEYQWGANLNFTYVPMYGKFALDEADRGHRPRQPQLLLQAEGRLQRRHRSAHLPESLVRREPRGARLHLQRAAREPEHRDAADQEGGGP
jgi:hypothetical protein